MAKQLAGSVRSKPEECYWVKGTDASGKAICVEDFAYSLPNGKRPGKWHAVKGEPVVCAHGFHVTTPRLLDKWCHYIHDRIFVAEIRGLTTVADTKVAAQQMRLVREVLVVAERDNPWQPNIKATRANVRRVVAELHAEQEGR